METQETDTQAQPTPSAPPPSSGTVPTQTMGQQVQAATAGMQQQPQQPPQEAAPAHKGFFSDLLHAVADVFEGPKYGQHVNPQTGAIEQVPLSREQRIGGQISTLLRGAAAGAAEHGPGAVGKAALAGVQSADQARQMQQERLQQQSANVRATNSAEQQKLLTQANLAKNAQEQVRMALDIKAKQQELDEHQVAIGAELMKLKSMPGVQEMTSFSTNDELNKHLEAVGPETSKQYAVDVAKNNIVPVMGPDGIVHVLKVPKDTWDQPVGEGHKYLVPSLDPNDPKGTLKSYDVDPNTTLAKMFQVQGNYSNAYYAKLEEQNKLAEQQGALKKLPAEIAHMNAETNLADTQARMLINSQQADPFGNTSTLPQKEVLKRQDAFQKDVVNKAYDTEKAFQMSQQAFTEYQNALKQGKTLPTGAQSMLLLSQHLGTTFGNVKGSRITKDMIAEHLGARGVSDAAHVAVQRLVNGDQLSSAQWAAFTDLISQSRNATWENAVSNARNQGLPITFLPRGNGQTPLDPATARIYLDAAGGDKDKARAAAQKQGWVLQ